MIKGWLKFINSVPKDVPVYIYGAGMAAYYLGAAILKEGYSFDAFVVSERNGNVTQYFGISVITIDELCTRSGSEKNAYILIGTLETFHKEIKLVLSSYGFSHIYTLTQQDYQEIRTLSINIDAEMFRGICNVSKDVVRLKMQFGKVESRLNSFITGLYEDLFKGAHYYLGTNFDRRRYLKDFKALIEDEKQFEYKVERLVQGLDCESAETVYQIIHRLNCLNENIEIYYTKSEREKVQTLRDDFYSAVYKITEKKYFYQGYLLPENHFEASVFFYEHALQYLHYPQKLQNKNVIDAGGFIGDSALVLSKYPVKTIFSFEAIERNYKAMHDTIKMNHCTNIVPIQKALLDRKGHAALYLSKTNNAGNSVFINGMSTEADSEKVIIECTTLDQFVMENNLKDIGLIKIDIEGAEQQFLRGAVETLKKFRPTLSISIYHNLYDFFEIKPWIDSLDLGYQFQIVRPVLEFSFLTETVLLAETEPD